MIALAALLALSLQSTPEKQTVPLPESKQTFDLVKIPGGPGVRPFWIGAREVTWAEYNVYFAELPEVRKKADLDGVTRPTKAKTYFGDVGVSSETLSDPRPVTNVRWHGALGYCEWLTNHTGRVFRLPTEKEWELAARAGETAAAPKDLDAVAWHAGNGGTSTHDVGTRKPNAFGVYDMLGNVWEYCLEPDGSSGFAPVLRGGSWSVPAAQSGFAARRSPTYDWFSSDCVRPRSVWWLGSNKTEQGFRVVCVDGAADAKDREAASAKLPIKILGSTDVDVTFTDKDGKPTLDQYWKLSLEVTNGTGRTLDELEVRAFILKPNGKPHLWDKEVTKPGRATFASGWPVLGSSAAPAAAPLKPGETRTFAVTMPQSFDSDEEVAYGKFGASVMNVRFAKE